MSDTMKEIEQEFLQRQSELRSHRPEDFGAFLESVAGLVQQVPGQTIDIPADWARDYYGEAWEAKLRMDFADVIREFNRLGGYAVYSSATGPSTIRFGIPVKYRPSPIARSSTNALEVALNNYKRGDPPMLLDLKDYRIAPISLRQIVSRFNSNMSRRISVSGLDHEGRFYEITERAGNEYNVRGYRTDQEKANRLAELQGKVVDNGDDIFN